MLLRCILLSLCVKDSPAHRDLYFIVPLLAPIYRFYCSCVLSDRVQMYHHLSLVLYTITTLLQIICIYLKRELQSAYVPYIVIMTKY